MLLPLVVGGWCLNEAWLVMYKNGSLSSRSVPTLMRRVGSHAVESIRLHREWVVEQMCSHFCIREKLVEESVLFKNWYTTGLCSSILLNSHCKPSGTSKKGKGLDR